VDLALLVKEDQERTNPITINMPVSMNQLSEMAKNSSQKQPQIPKGALPTPTHSPPNTPSSQQGSTSAAGSGTNLTSPVTGGLASSLGTAYLASSLSGLVKPQKAKKKKTKVRACLFKLHTYYITDLLAFHCTKMLIKIFLLFIQHNATVNAEINSSRLMPTQIREAIRRYQMSRTPITTFSVSTLKL